jgi:small-conductance mechanosensitive channel
VGINAENGKKLLFTVVFAVVVVLLGRIIRVLISHSFPNAHKHRAGFWSSQVIDISVAVLLVLGIISIWFDDPQRLATAVGLVTAGLAFALQKFVSAVAGYFVILRGNTFNVGDRIVMGGVRGDVVALSFTQTTVMEMGQPPPVQSADPAMWVKSRQYTGRLVAISNARVFDEPVYNYTREFPYIWEEISLPVPYTANRRAAEEILFKTVERHSVRAADLSAEALAELRRRYAMKDSDVRPKIYYRLTDNWLEMTARFITEDHGTREVKDAIFRELLDGLDSAQIAIASATFELVGTPEVKIELTPSGISNGVT